MLAAYLIYRIFRRVRELTRALLKDELIEVDGQAVTFTRSGFLNIERKVAYPADSIAAVRTTRLGSDRCLYLTFILGGAALTRFRISMDQVFCRGISESDAAATLARIHERFPQYRDIKA